MNTKAAYRWNMILAEANTCHNCGVFREPGHDCPTMQITKIIWDQYRAGRRAA